MLGRRFERVSVGGRSWARRLAAGLGALLVLAAMPKGAAAQTCRADADCPEDKRCTEGSCVAAAAPDVHWSVHIPDGYRAELRSYPILAITGAAAFGAAWIATIAITAASAPADVRAEAAGVSVVPVAGGFLALSHVPRRTEPALVATGVAQGLGLLTAFVGITIQSRVLVPIGKSASVELAPTGPGAVATMRF